MSVGVAGTAKYYEWTRIYDASVPQLRAVRAGGRAGGGVWAGRLRVGGRACGRAGA